VITGVGVEKLDIAEIRTKSGIVNVQNDPIKVFIGHPDAMRFLRIYDN